MDNPNPQKPWWMDSFVFFSRISGWIIGPVVLAFIAGEIVSSKWPSLHWLGFVFIGLAFVSSCYGVVKETLAHLKKLKQDVTDTDGTEKETGEKEDKKDGGTN